MIWTALGAALLILAAAPVIAERLRPAMDARARREATGDFAQLEEGVTCYRWYGPSRGPVVVCIHGLTTPSYVWVPIAEALALRGFRVLTYDLFGRGLSDRPGGVQDRDFFLDQLEQLLADQGVRRPVTLMGYSMGGAIATAFAATYPDRVARLVLLAPAGLGHTPGPFAEFTRKTPVLGDWLMLVFGGWVYRRGIDRHQPVSAAIPDIARRQMQEMRPRGTLRAVLSSRRHILSEDIKDDHRKLAEAHVPVLAIWGEDDRTIPLAAMGRLGRINRTARQVSFPGAGHGLPYTHPREVIAALSDALREG